MGLFYIEGSPDNVGGNAYNEDIADKSEPSALASVPIVKAFTDAHHLLRAV